MQVKVNSNKWSRNSSAAAGDYAAGVASPRRPWAASAAAAHDNYAAGVTEAAAKGSFAKGVNAAGDSKWSAGVQNKGRTRYSQGVTVSEADYNAGFAPFAAALQSTTLTPRGPKGTNYTRVQEVGEALRKAKGTK